MNTSDHPRSLRPVPAPITTPRRPAPGARPWPTLALALALATGTRAVAQRTITWQIDAGPVTTVVDGTPADGSPIPGVVSTPISFTPPSGAWTLNGVVTGKFIAGMGIKLVQLSHCAITHNNWTG